MKKFFKIIFTLFVLGFLSLAGLVASYVLYPKPTKQFVYKSITTVTPMVFQSEAYTENTHGVHPFLYDKVVLMKDQLRKEGIHIKVIRGYRSMEEQQKLYAQGRTTKGGIVTNAIPGLSYHNYGWAVDVAIYENGKINWKSKHWNRVGEVGKSHGLVWGGDWTRLVDKPHFQLKVSDILF